MPDSNKNTQKKKEAQNQSEIPVPLSILLTLRRPLIISAHIAVFVASLMLSFLLANNMQLRRTWLIEQYPLLLCFFIIIKLIVFGFFKQYRGWWRYVGISDLVQITAASLASTFIIVSLWFIVVLNIPPIRRILQNLTEVSQGVFMADMFATVMMLAGLRMLIRLYHEEFHTVESGRLKRLLIVGAGDPGEAFLRETHRKRIEEYEVVGFIDDDPHKQGTTIHGISVLGTVDQMPEICKEQNIEEIVIAMPSADPKELRRVIQVCAGIKIRFRIARSITDVSQIRDVDINDLLGRDVVNLDLDLIETYTKDKTIMVTGAGGSIGSEMSRQLCNFKPKLILLLEQAENPLFFIERDLNTQFPRVPLKAIVCDIADKIRVEQIFGQYKPQVVIHAAAHKHVPLMELNPGEAVKNNVVGTQTVANAADKYGTAHFVMISTDKAVNPTSIMGSSKRIAEIYIQDLNRTSKTNFVTVRFGNVLDSNGSVIPIFKKQITQGGPVTVTHPKMKRYFMTIPEASQLVLQAAAMGQGGEIFLLDMGEPVKIVDLARELITLSGFGEDIEIKFTGPRPGEKLFEELSIKGEDMQPTRHPKISIWKNIPMDRQALRTGIDELVNIAETQNHDQITQKISQLVPEYTGPDNENNSA